MNCSSCRCELPGSARFCPQCGTAQPVSCAQCGSVLEPLAKFCSACGTPAGTAPATVQNPPQSVTGPETWSSSQAAESQPNAPPPVPPELRARIESVRSELSGERREVAVLFADLSGFTAMSEQLDAEEMTFMMSRLMQALSAAVHRYEGYVDKFIGDAIMALFGAPLAHENDPERAVLTALAMLDVIEQHNRTADIPLALRVGINLGEVIATHLTSGQRLQYTVLGDVVNVASRLEGKASPNSVLVSEAVFRRVAGRFKGEKLPPLSLKGKAEPVQAYRILGLHTGGTVAAGTRTPFVGREMEIAAIQDFVARVPLGTAGTLVLEGDAGMGKTRLVQEVLARSRNELIVVETGFSPMELPGRRSAGLEIFHQLLPEEPAGRSAVDRALNLLGAEADRYRAGVEGLAAESDPAFAAFAASIDVSPEVARQNRWAALAALLRRSAQTRPLLLVLEDIHWMDEATQEFLDFLGPVLSGAALGMLLVTRPRAAGSWRPSGAQGLALQPLETRWAETMLERLLDDVIPPERRDLIRRGEGNPLFLEELARAIREAPPAGVATTAVPGTLQGLLVSRIDRLEPPVRLLLQMAAVLGTYVPTALLARMYCLEDQPLTFDDALHALERAEFLDVELNGEDRRRFRQALVQEVAYAGLLMRIRKVLHESAARLGEEHYSGQLEAEAPFFAHHYWEGGLREAAAPHLWAAGRAACERHELAAAERFLQRLAEVIQKSSEVLEDVEARVAFHRMLGNVLLHRGKLDDAEAQFHVLEILGTSHERGDWVARGMEYRGRIEWYRGRLDGARSLFEE
ncbi:MAG: AAA family ATPase, partial [Gemmatimonadetes bacterium]|nr:AAA family ATPase [Gemmatimonadota bacterium]